MSNVIIACITCISDEKALENNITPQFPAIPNQMLCEPFPGRGCPTIPPKGVPICCPVPSSCSSGSLTIEVASSGSEIEASSGIIEDRSICYIPCVEEVSSAAESLSAAPSTSAEPEEDRSVCYVPCVPEEESSSIPEAESEESVAPIVDKSICYVPCAA